MPLVLITTVTNCFWKCIIIFYRFKKMVENKIIFLITVVFFVKNRKIFLTVPKSWLKNIFKEYKILTDNMDTNNIFH